MKLRRVIRLMWGVVMIAVSCGAAFAACAAPAQSGLALCFPSAGATVLYPATIELAANSGGVPITHVTVYDGSAQVDELGYIPGQLVDYALKNGNHQVTVNAWDANGKLYQAKTSFTVTGFGVGACGRGGGVITLCSPGAGMYEPESSVPISAAFAAGVKSWSVTLDGRPVIDSAEAGQPTSAALQTLTAAGAGNHTLVIKAVGANGVTSTLTRGFPTFYDLNCNPKSGNCTPGIMISKPNDIGTDSAGDEATSFQLQAEVQYNPKPTTKMVVYVDGVKVEQSAGPGITADVNVRKGTHYVVVLAWDTAGKMYETYGNVNVN